MKKAKIIIPSLALLCFSAIACVTGSVAWFSSVTTASLATSNFEVKVLDGTMSATVTPGVGTKKDTSATTTTTIIPDTYNDGTEDVSNVLTHGSFDANSQKVYSIMKFSSVTAPEYEQIGTGKTLEKTNESSFWASGTEGYYHVFSFDIEFKYDFGTSKNQKYNLYFDVQASTVTRGSKATKDLDTAKGFRMAFINTSDATRWVVWSKLQKDTYNGEEGKPSRYIGVAESGTPATVDEIEYTTGATGRLIYDGDTSISKISGGSGSASRKDCLGQFDAGTSGGEKTITIRVVAWYEGDDPNVVKDADLATVATTLEFYLKSNAAA